jgi:glycosyltransferase involved in cell wall biosynthesis
MNIEILCTDGSPLGITAKTLWGDGNRIGLGGSEYLLVTLCEEWTKAGHSVVLYNDPWEANASIFEQRPVAAYQPKNKQRDVLIIFRSPNEKAIVSDGLKVWLSCDQYTIGDFEHFSKFVDKIVCISPFHAEYFKTEYGIENTTVIDIPVRVDDFSGISHEMVKNRVIFTSVPDRGLENLWRIWRIVKKSVKDASLVITADYRLWGASALNEKHRVRWMAHDDVEFLGAISRQELLVELLEAQLFVYPSIYDELFCVACSEAQYAGVWPITNDRAALATTNMGTVLALDVSDPRNDKPFADVIIKTMSDYTNLKSLQAQARKNAYERFRPEVILQRWNEEIFT